MVLSIWFCKFFSIRDETLACQVVNKNVSVHPPDSPVDRSESGVSWLISQTHRLIGGCYKTQGRTFMPDATIAGGIRLLTVGVLQCCFCRVLRQHQSSFGRVESARGLGRTPREFICQSKVWNLLAWHSVNIAWNMRSVLSPAWEASSGNALEEVCEVPKPLPPQMQNEPRSVGSK